MNATNKVKHWARTDVGMKRSHNQDAFGVALAGGEEAWRTKGHFFLVADGMGAHAVGELASKLAVDTVRLAYSKSKGDEPGEMLRAAFEEANHTIHERGKQNQEFQGMGTTATALVLLPDGARVGHVGDSRCYRIRGNSIEQLTFDHSLLWELARKHKVEPERITSVPSNIIVRSLGPEPKVRVDVNGPYPIVEGDRFLLCSDGLSGPVDDTELWAIGANLPLDEATQLLVDLANLRGGMDNITVLLVQVGDPNERSTARPDPWFTSANLWRTLRHVPLSWWFLLTGLSTSALGYLMAALGVGGWQYLGLMGSIAAILLVSAFVGLRLRRKRLSEDQKKPKPSPPPIYRRLDCQIDRPIVERFASIEQNLRELAIEQNWKIDWAVLGQVRSQAAEELEAQRLTDAFRDYCRSIALLAGGVRGNRERPEVFLPTWERRATK